MPRKNFGVALGRPPKLPTAGLKPPKMPGGPAMATPAGVSPMGSFAPGLPAKAFKTGGKAGYACMPSHHDDPKYCKGGGVK